MKSYIEMCGCCNDTLICRIEMDDGSVASIRKINEGKYLWAVQAGGTVLAHPLFGTLSEAVAFAESFSPGAGAMVVEI